MDLNLPILRHLWVRTTGLASALPFLTVLSFGFTGFIGFWYSESIFKGQHFEAFLAFVANLGKFPIFFQLLSFLIQPWLLITYHLPFCLSWPFSPSHPHPQRMQPLQHTALGRASFSTEFPGNMQDGRGYLFPLESCHFGDEKCDFQEWPG